MPIAPLMLAFGLLQSAPGENPTATAQLRVLFAEYDEWMREQFPAFAMAQGDYRHADRLGDSSLAAIEARNAASLAFLERLQAIPREDVEEQDRVSAGILELILRQSTDGHRFRLFLAPIGSRGGLAQQVAQMHERVRFASADDYADYLGRLEQVPKVVDDEIALMTLGIAEGRTPPRVTLEGVPEQMSALLEGGALDALATPFDRMPETIDAATRAGLRSRFDERSLPGVRTALARLDRYLRDTYLPACRTTIAASDWPDGAAAYAHLLAVHTTLDLPPEEIHRIGLAEVARLRTEMLAVIRRTDYMERHDGADELDDDALFAAFLADLRTNARFYATDGEELLRRYRDICKRIDGWLPRMFRVLPRLSYGVQPIPTFMAPAQTTAYYQPGDLRNGEAGNFCVNLHRLDMRPTYEMVPLALHEAVPGHHLQISLAKELDGLPEFRRQAGFTAFVEGWALYAERLGIENGMYADPYDDFGRLLFEMWRACRLVVDPGIHALGWSRQQAIDFMQANTALSELNIAVEVDRYISWPGQACGYKIGELRIRALREEAERRLGPAFDIRAFHEVVLGAGAVPLGVLEERVRGAEASRDRGIEASRVEESGR